VHIIPEGDDIRKEMIKTVWSATKKKILNVQDFVNDFVNTSANSAILKAKLKF
jgi:hypothetical protein